GVDHIPIHHTNEIAQSEAYLADAKPWVRWWLHGEFINLSGAKISKSGGGGVLVTDLIDRGYHPLVYRYLLLQAHYRSQTEFSWAAMDSAQAGLRRLLDRYAAARSAPPRSAPPRSAPPRSAPPRSAPPRSAPPGSALARSAPADQLSPAAAIHLEAFDQAVSDDLNTARALASVIAASRDDRLSDADLTALASQFEQVLAIGLTDLSPAHLDLKPSDTPEPAPARGALVPARDAPPPPPP